MFIYELGLEIAGTDVISSSRLVEVRQRGGSTAGGGGVGSEKEGGLLTPIQGLLPEAPGVALNRDKHLFQRIPTHPHYPLAYLLSGSFCFGCQEAQG